MNDHPTVAAYGSWNSAIGLDEVVAAGASMSDLIADGDDLWWLETLPEQDGRAAIMRLPRGGQATEVTGPQTNVRSRVNEYGGGSFDVRDGVLAFCDDADRSVKLRTPDGRVQTLTDNDERLRYADLRVYPSLAAVLAVREDHRNEGEPEHTIVALEWPAAEGTPGAEHVLCSGADFYANPALSSDRRLAWIEWQHPAMPWDATVLKVGRLSVGSDGWSLRQMELVAGRERAGLDGIAVQHPRWLADGKLVYVSDASGYFQLSEWDGRQSRALHADAADFDLPMFVLGNHCQTELSADSLMGWRLDEGLCQLAEISRTGEPTRRLAGVAAVDSVAAVRGVGYAIVDRPADPRALVRVEVDGKLTVLRSCGASPDPDYVSVARSLVFNGRHGPVQTWFYPPANEHFRSIGAARPPALMRVHGGPTAMTTNAYNATIQFWTSRGFAVLDVNYSGSSGFGRRWRNRLRGMWGVADVDDCIDAAEAAIDAGLIDPGRIAISGGSAGGLTTLRALQTSDRFAAGISRYGVADLTALLDTHKFESRYLDSLVGDWPADEKLYRTRSPINNLQQLRTPILLLQGTDDPVVPLEQSTKLAEAARARGLDVELVVFEGEGHGFRRAETRARALASEFKFLCRVFAIES